MNKINTLLLIAAIGSIFTSCDTTKKSIDPVPVIQLMSGSSEIGSPAGINFTTVNNVSLNANTQFAFRLNIIAPRAFQSLEITKEILGNTTPPQLIYLGVSGYDSAPYIINRVLAGTLTTATSANFGGFPNPIGLKQTAVPFSSSYTTSLSGFVLRTGAGPSGTIEKYNFKVTDTYGREGNNYLNVTIN